MKSDLFTAILAMDSYNQGYGANLVTNASSIGNADVIARQAVGITDSAYQNWQSVGFYAIAYDTSHVADYGANTVISYRGTNTTAPTEFAKDFLHGWSLFTGVGSNSQAALA